MIKIEQVVRDIKDKGKEKWINRYQKIARMFHDEDYEQANREARDFICELNGQGVRNNSVRLEVYIISVDPSIKAVNLDIGLIEEMIRELLDVISLKKPVKRK
jgi:predicted SAM-dependent methyltransferase